MRILAFSTSSEVLSVCVMDKGIVKARYHSREDKKHSVVLMPAIDNALRSAGLDIRMIDLFVCDTGPGSFTGIRIGTAVANAFLAASDKKVLGITSLDALHQGLLPYEGMMCVMIHARNDQIYAAAYSEGELCGGYYAGSISTYLDILKEKHQDRKITFAGDASGLFFADIKQRFNEAVFAGRCFDSINAVSMTVYACGKGGGRDFLVPLYLKASSAKER